MRTRQVEISKEIHRRTGSTFYVATRLFPKRVRRATYVLYAFFRIADEVVDAAERRPPAERAERLERLRAAACGRVETDSPVVAAFREVKARHGIPDEEVDAFVDAMATDIDTRRYDTYDALESYMRGSAAAVGAMMTAIMGPDDPEAALPHARTLGEAFQLTNFLRDVREDVVERDRIYLPRETLAANGVPESQVEDLEFSPAFADAMRAELARAERRYREGVAGIRYLPADCRFPVLLAAVLYAEHHRLVRAQGCDVLSERPTLGRARTLWLVARTRWRWWWNPDPEAVFYRVGAVHVGDARDRRLDSGGESATPRPEGP